VQNDVIAFAAWKQPETLAAARREAILGALARCGYDVALAAKRLQVPLVRLTVLMKTMKLSNQRVRTPLSCPLLSGPLTMRVWIKEGTTNACEKAQSGRDHREAA
jgi:hypothetical protein